MRGLKDRTVLVTGGANGIGAATARRLAEEGCTVGILDMDAAAGEDVAGEIEITSVRPTSKGNRGIVVSRIDVKNQKDEVVMTNEATRMLAGRSADQGTPQTA